ncbi:MAG: envelope stress response membrane protein PspC [Candidatus Andeanibacterium colombiense]|uniref:Envelope stress response membrane protein PspC n=1 Tax=Candidatus Andeanibacterium colombiense TaxID=3121345 RepID=A0AAJ6BMM9_9SPHN|nr:MAG: envelope stress response membrane protein PspC [Sphingomonadaceae bacterium]
MNSPRTTLYRDKQNGKLMGVCSGIADYTGVSVGWVRLGALVLIGMTGGWIIPLYFGAGFILNKKPVGLYEDRAEQKYWQQVRQSPKRTAREIRARFRDIDHRLAEVENYYVSNNARLSAEIERLR